MATRSEHRFIALETKRFSPSFHFPPGGKSYSRFIPTAPDQIQGRTFPHHLHAGDVFRAGVHLLRPVLQKVGRGSETMIELSLADVTRR